MSKSKTTGINMEALSRIDSRDMLILQDTAGRVMTDLSRYHTMSAADGEAAEVASRENLESVYGFSPRDEEDRKPFVYQDGVAVIPIHGTLLNRFNGSWGFVTGFQYIRRMMNAALDDDDVEQIVFDVDSPGGEAAGCFELAREIMASRRVKPSLAMVDSLAASGGIALAAGATVVYAIPSARVGSIGVYRMHVSYEDALKQAGIKVTFAEAGDHKTEGNPYKDLPEAVLNEWTESARKTWDDFISLVAEARDLTEDEVRATQASVYRADEALAKGLINAVKTPTEAVAAFLAELADDDTSMDEEEEIEMAEAKKEVTSGLTAADLASIKSMVMEASVAAVSTLSASLQRSQQIKDYAAGKGKQFAALASTLAADESISVESATAIIDAAAGNAVAAPVAKPKKAKGQKAADPEDDDNDDDDDGDAEEGNDDDDDGDDDGDDAEEQSRSRRRSGRDNVNHFERAMKGKSKGVGGGKAKGEEDGEQGSGRKGGNRLLAAHASVTGADWSSKAVSGSKH